MYKPRLTKKVLRGLRAMAAKIDADIPDMEEMGCYDKSDIEDVERAVEWVREMAL